MKLRKGNIATIPNLLSLMRLLMIPVFVSLYINGSKEWTALVLMISALTDVVDGYIARRFNQISDFGKALDPLADKLTQMAMLICLSKQHQVVLLPLGLLVMKESFAAVSGIVVILRTGIVPGAEWHGKLTTMLLYGMMILHVLWQDIPLWLSNTINVTCVMMMLISMVSYGRRNIRIIRSASRNVN